MARQVRMETQRPAATVVPLNRDRISTHVRNLLTEVAPDRIDALLPIIERCVTQAVAPPQERAFASRSGPLSTAATSAGTDLMARATELPFPEFVAKLITGT